MVLPGATPPAAASSTPAPAAAVPGASAPQAATGTPAANFVSTGASTEAAAPPSSSESTPAAATADPAAATSAPVEAAAPAEPPPPPEPTLVININLSTQRMTISEDGAAKYTWPISSAAPGYSTPTGTFKPSWMTKMWYSRQYDMSPMPHSIFFSGGTAIHATQAIRYLGRPASHGCVRLAPSNAATLFKMVSRHGKSMTKIVVHGSPRYQVTSRSYGSRELRIPLWPTAAPPAGELLFLLRCSAVLLRAVTKAPVWLRSGEASPVRGSRDVQPVLMGADGDTILKTVAIQQTAAGIVSPFHQNGFHVGVGVKRT